MDAESQRVARTRPLSNQHLPTAPASQTLVANQSHLAGALAVHSMQVQTSAPACLGEDRRDLVGSCARVFAITDLGGTTRTRRAAPYCEGVLFLCHASSISSMARLLRDPWGLGA